VTQLSSVKAYIALGANLGNRVANLRAALNQLAAIPFTRVTAISTFLENPAVGGPPNSPPFLNAVAEVQTSQPPHDLLDRLLEIEKALGRQRLEKWGPRTIDLDLLLYGNLILVTANLTLPHPRMHERRFVLQPLAEIAPDLVVPGLDKTVGELLEALQASDHRQG
jgi:2-amino-4-hydroxy-6-hydroxymethyldihydropteridine diphosphokinase